MYQEALTDATTQANKLSPAEKKLKQEEEKTRVAGIVLKEK